MERSIQQYIIEHRQEIAKGWLDTMKDVSAEPLTNVVSENVYISMNSEFLDIIFSHQIESPEHFRTKLEEFIERVVKLGWPLTYLTRAIRLLRKVILELLMEDEFARDDNYVPMETVQELELWAEPIYHELEDIYATSWENTINLQKVALQELSAPLIPIFDNITVMPLVGTIDTERASIIMENLLEGVVKHRSEVVLIDITGVPVVDTMVAHHIIQASEAVRLVGAKCLIVGIRPEIAQTIVNLGIRLDQVITKNSLRVGVERALEITNRQIISMEE
ncbi:STAS domain-containing protein [Priestia filamentosa]|uniref:STAS domain-containing protein n=1 Tax=Priestia filamentosa TaxID=1402861 RepID=UPI00234A44F8|nr:STAS domain-containing protein [Priestia filamentosa]WCM16064.1 STAS domain-containing protein [Priestia filamentosa]